MLKAFFSMFKEPDVDKVSFTRVTGFMFVVSFISVFLYFAFFKNQIIDMPKDFGLFIFGLYGANKTPTVVKQIFNKNKEDKANSGSNK